MTSADAAFVSLSELTAPEQLPAYIRWHQVDHLPENLLLPGVLSGERWVRTPQCRAASLTATEPFDTFQYLTLYRFRPPITESIAQWTDLAARSFRWGRPPDLAWTLRAFMGVVQPIRGSVAPQLPPADAPVP